MSTAAERTIPVPVLDALREQNASRGSTAVDRSLAKLAEPGAAVVVTGQQMGLFLGPLFTVYKAASAIAIARALAEETGHPVVPVFWLQTEDHDLPEIDHCVLPTGEASPPTLRLSLADVDDPASSRRPVGPLVLGPGITEVLAALKTALAHHPHAEGHLSLVERAYRPDATLAESFAGLLGSLFADHGLLVLDPRRPSLAEHARLFYRRVLDEAGPISSALAVRSRDLETAGFGVQVHVRPGSPLCFYAPEGEDGPRYRLDPTHDEGGWTTVSNPPRTLSEAELLQHLEDEPLRFTTSALLRPLLQDSWLPTAAYVGGPGELNYFAQLPPLYAAFGLPMPLVVPRARFRLVDDRATGLLEKLDLTPDEACRPVDEVLAHIARRTSSASGEHPTPADVETQLLGPVQAPFAAFAAQAVALDPSLQKAVDAAERAIREAVERVVGKYGRVLARRDEVTVERVHRLAALLAPGGAPQERVYGFTYFACRYGGAALMQSILDEVRPFDSALRDLRL